MSYLKIQYRPHSCWYRTRKMGLSTYCYILLSSAHSWAPHTRLSSAYVGVPICIILVLIPHCTLLTQLWICPMVNILTYTINMYNSLHNPAKHFGFLPLPESGASPVLQCVDQRTLSLHNQMGLSQMDQASFFHPVTSVQAWRVLVQERLSHLDWLHIGRSQIGSVYKRSWLFQ